VMTSPAITIGPDDPIDAAVELILRRRIGCVPVVERNGLVGIVTRSDLLDRETAASTAEPLAAGSAEAVSAAPWTRLVVDAVMSRDPVTALADDALSMIVERMARMGIRHVPVIDGERRVIGILSDRDVRTAIGNPLRALRTRDAIVRIESTRVGHAMSRSPVTVAAGTRLSRVAALFVDRKVGILPVVDDAERLAGIVSYTDVLRAVLGPKSQAN
ncbi:MAG TPA: CBS domain-containing protein, partial [Polyangia bacterium]